MLRWFVVSLGLNNCARAELTFFNPPAKDLRFYKRAPALFKFFVLTSPHLLRHACCSGKWNETLIVSRVSRLGCFTSRIPRNCYGNRFSLWHANTARGLDLNLARLTSCAGQYSAVSWRDQYGSVQFFSPSSYAYPCFNII